MRNFILILFILGGTISVQAQTNVSSGPVTGTWKKSNSPYKINGQIYVPKDSTLRIEAGVKVEFQGAYMLHVYGSLQALGKIGDSVVFTPLNKTAGWQGIHIHKNKVGADSNLFRWSKFEYVKYFNYNVINLVPQAHGALHCDSINNIRITNSVFNKNSSNSSCGIKFWLATGSIENCNFTDNYCTDSRGNSGTSAVGSCITGYNSKLIILNCEFTKNISEIPGSLSDSTSGLSQGPIVVGDGITIIKNCTFTKNRATRASCISLALSPAASVSIEKCNFVNNYSSTFTAVYLGGSIPNNTNISIKECQFRNNITGYIYSNPTSLDCRFSNSAVEINASQFLTENGYRAIAMRKINMNNCRISGSDSLAISLNKISGSQIKNCIISNNGLALDVTDNGSVIIVGCIIANNGTNNKSASLSKGGLFMSYSGNYMIYNSIIQNNYNRNGMANLLGGFGGTTCQALNNSIVQGGTDSAKLLFVSGNMTFNNKSNVINDTVQFVKPPGGVGPAHYNPNNDFHIKNTCTYTYPGLNAGLNIFTDAYSGITINNANTTDLDGNPRIRCGTVDIGPYELEGSKQSVSIDTEPTDQSICPKTVATIAPSTCGAGLGYQWQQSSNGTTFSNISGANNVNYSIKPQDSGWYRLIITQSECNKKDTSRAAKIAFKAGGKMSLIANAKDSTLCSKQPIALQANITNANSYQWQESNDGSTFNNINGATANPYNTNTSNTQWYRLIAKNTLCNYSDTFAAAKVTVNPLPTPNLGADIAIPNSGNKVLNPGTFTTYSWSTGASTPTLTVDKTNLAIGANNISVEVTGTNGCKAADTIIVTLEPANGLQDPSKVGISVYPIPASDNLTIDIPESTSIYGLYFLTTIEGKVLETGNLKHQLALNISDLTTGTYLLSLEIEGVRYGMKVIK